jgi:hypothetical protein
VSSFRKANAAGRQPEHVLPTAGTSPVGPAPDVWATPLVPPDDGAADTRDMADIGESGDTTDLRDEEPAVGAA